jgi:lipoprotein-releasing system ATP-binding protein
VARHRAEPNGNLDTSSAANVQKIVKDLAHEHGRAVLIVTHDPRFSASADRAIAMVDGRIIAA